MSANSAEDFYSLKALKINGDTLHFSELRGKKLMIVNVASYCGYTSQYAQLQSLYEQFGGEKFEIIGFPANNFSNQEPGTDEQIDDFCRENYGVTFTMMSKISVVGADKHPVYKWLTELSKNGVTNQEVLWNFQKWMITENGKIWRIFSTQTSPLHQDIINWLSAGTSVQDLSKSGEIYVYPNPASVHINFVPKLVNNSVDYINIIDLQGKVVKKIHLASQDFNNEIMIDINDLSAGTYYLQYGIEHHFFIKN